MNRGYRNRMAWAAVILLTVLCGMMGILQHRWIDEVSQAERERLQNELKNKLDFVSMSFDDAIKAKISALMPAPWQIERVGMEAAYADRFQRWRDLHSQLFSRIAIAVWRDGSLKLLEWDARQGRLNEVTWPAEWRAARERIAAGQGVKYDPELPQMIDLPRFGPSPVPVGLEHAEEDLILELNLPYLRDTLFPDLFRRFLSDGVKLGKRGERLDYDARVYVADRPSAVIFQSSGLVEGELFADATAPLLELPHGPQFPSPLSREGPAGPVAPAREQGRWILAAHHRAGSLEAIVERARRRNLMISTSLLLLIVATTVLLVRLSQERERFAELQMRFVTGVSHELRTPLSVIRTAAFNLRGRMSQNPAQVESYGKLIQNESEKLGELVERVLLFARTKSGGTGHLAEPVTITALLEQAICLNGGQEAAPRIDVRIEPSLPRISVDVPAVRMALRNIIENAIKYADCDHPWTRVYASRTREDGTDWVEIRVADNGPGIPLHEQGRIFDPFFRGERALRDQIHGTGLGLNLAKSAIEANNGTIHVGSEQNEGTEFVIRFRAAGEASS